MTGKPNTINRTDRVALPNNTWALANGIGSDHEQNFEVGLPLRSWFTSEGEKMQRFDYPTVAVVRMACPLLTWFTIDQNSADAPTDWFAMIAGMLWLRPPDRLICVDCISAAL